MAEQKQKQSQHSPEEIIGRIELMAGILKKDAQIYHLESEKLQMLQKLYDLEMKMYGRQSRMAGDLFEAERCEVLNGKARKMTDAEWEEKVAHDDKMAGQKTEKNDSVHGKLDHYKSLEKRQPDRRMEPGQKRETPERV